jgi:hypothetical protein
MPESQSSGAPEAVETPGDAAIYIATLTDELAEIARRHGLEALGYILDMARLEADQIARSSG